MWLGRIGSEYLPGLNHAISNAWHSRTMISIMGILMASHWTKEICCIPSSELSAIAFCGEAIGVPMPPMLLARAMPRRRHFARGSEFGGKPRMTGSIREFSNTGVATLLIHMERKTASNIRSRSTWLGRPARASTIVATVLSSANLDSAAAREYPPMMRSITEELIEEIASFAASCAGISLPFSVRKTCRRTERVGTASAVT
mmetsp:Transcript_4250/g.12793  ORF Transcript_4250/g.12793 Transcript_4250/m.12793 type:complete len:202 (-) Transcript_4250:1328-1933(-)